MLAWRVRLGFDCRLHRPARRDAAGGRARGGGGGGPAPHGRPARRRCAPPWTRCSAPGATGGGSPRRISPSTSPSPSLRGNPLFRAFTGVVETALRRLFRASALQFAAPRSRANVARHAAIVDAIEAGDAEERGTGDVLGHRRRARARIEEGPMNDTPRRLRSRAWFDNPANIDMTALYLERYLNFGLSLEELQSGKPIIGIAQTGSRPLALQPPPPRARRARARGHPRGRRHRASSSRSIRSRRPASGRPPGSTATSPISALVEVLYGYPLDGVVLTIGCDKTTPACLMAAATVEHSGHRALGRADAQRLAQGRAHRLGHDRLEGARAARRGRDRPARASSSWSPPRRLRPATATRWARRRR